MSYYMRYISTDASEITLEILNKELQAGNQRYSVDESGELRFGDDVLGVVEINVPSQELFGEEIEELKEFVKGVRGWKRKEVLKALNAARTIVAVQVLFDGQDADAVLEKLMPLWDWLLANRNGLLQADDEGYYNKSGLILKVE